MAALKLFDVPATGQVTSKRKAASVDRIKVNHKIAKRRYYYHRHLAKFYQVDGTNRQIDLPFKSFDEMPVGKAKYYVSQLLKLGYTVQFKII